MSEWREVMLGDICELKRGYDLPGRDREPGDVPVLSSSGVSGYHSVAKVGGPGVVTGRYGTLGEVFYVEDDFWPLNTALYVRDFKGNNPEFVATLLKHMDLAQHDGAAAVPGLNRNQLHRIPVSVPGRELQDRIARVVRVLDDLIENNWRRVEVLEEMARAIYREWFVHFRFPGNEDATFVDSDLGPIPEGWDVEAASYALEIKPRLGIDRNAEHPFVTMGDVSEHRLWCSPSEYRKGSSGAKFQNGDTLFARITPCLENGKTALASPQPQRRGRRTGVD